MNRIFAIKSYLRYLIKAGHRKGFGIHSPFVFSLLNDVFYEQLQYYCYERIEGLREELGRTKDVILVTDQGTGGYKRRKIGDIVKRSAKRTKYAQLLFRLANSNRSETMLELGTCVGLTTLYLSQVNRRGKVITLDADEAVCVVARENFRQFYADNIELHCGRIDDILSKVLKAQQKLDFVFFDANHTQTATLNYFELCLPKAHKDTIFVFDDIHRNAGMYEAWMQICRNPEIRLSIDVYEMGIVFFNEDLVKQEYIVAF
ncbi:MAG: SAM-dependent methyltransferase [Bacteroidetes bacterium]|jgi:predicted O-methyltransferase YrrM|nr:SAM-dependent methyltransferase [Bacteroidota bacterium]